MEDTYPKLALTGRGRGGGGGHALGTHDRKIKVSDRKIKLGRFKLEDRGH